MRQIDKAICSCGGRVKEVETTRKEENRYGCHNKMCCCRALKCTKCKTRFTLVLEAPDMESF